MGERDTNRALALKETHLYTLPPGPHDVRLVVAYPNRYWLAMSNLGFQSVFRLFTEEPRFNVQRAYYPETPEDNESWKTFETNEPLSSAEILALSVSFETDYPYVVAMLERAGLNLKFASELDSVTDQRERFFRPLIIGGGAALTLNPEPLANLFDAIVIGEGEEVIKEISSTYLAARDSGTSFDELLRQLSQIEGVYVPSLYRVEYHADHTVKGFQALDGAPERVVRRYLENIDEYASYTVIQTPETEFKSMFMTETGRGCEIGCKFCVAGYMYRPTRKRSEETIRGSLKIGEESSESVGFVGAAVSSHRSISKLASEVARSGKRAALSSIMSQKVTSELAGSLSESEYKTVALAPEAGSEGLRFRVGKRVTDETVLQGISTLAENGIRNFKLYFIVGLPSETEEDVDAIITLTERARDAALAAARKNPEFSIAPKLILSVNPFIPKAWTPFQRHEFLEFSEVKRRIARVERGVKRLANVEMKFESPRESYFQAIMSRGDRRVGDLLIYLHQNKLDWRWLVKNGSKEILKGVPVTDFYVHRRFGKDELLPWEIVDLRIKRSLLEREYEKTFE